MQCVTPMYRLFDLGDNKKARILSREEAQRTLAKEENAQRILRKNTNIMNSRQIQPIPCGKCWACRLNYSAEWATRIMHECESDKDHNWFITLTYDDYHVPISEKTGEYTLNPEDVKTFLNSLKRKYNRKGINNIKYFWAGEYGETTKRPHYHMILMHCPLDIEEFYGTHIDTKWKEHWKSREIEHYWNKGMVDIASVEWSSAAYVARYCTKKIFESPENYAEAEIEPEKVYMSKGIGFEYYEKHKDQIYETDQVIMKTIRGNTGNYKPPKAYDRKYKEEVGTLKWAAIKAKRRIQAERSANAKEQKSDYTDLELQKQNMEKLVTKSNMLPRIGNETIGCLD